MTGIIFKEVQCNNIYLHLATPQLEVTVRHSLGPGMFEFDSLFPGLRLERMGRDILWRA